MLILTLGITLLILPHGVMVREENKNDNIDKTSWSWRQDQERLNKQQTRLPSDSKICIRSSEQEFCGTDTVASDPDLNPEFSFKTQKTKVKEKLKMADLVALEFEVHGKVQGVYFRKFTKSKSEELGLRGWVRNTSKGTVVGELEGPQDKVKVMKKWLRETGSPKSNIAKTEFRNERNIPVFSLTAFDIRK